MKEKEFAFDPRYEATIEAKLIRHSDEARTMMAELGLNPGDDRDIAEFVLHQKAKFLTARTEMIEMVARMSPNREKDMLVGFLDIVEENRRWNRTLILTLIARV